MDGHAPANPLRRSLPGADRVKPERNLGAAKPPSAKSDTNLRPLQAQVAEPPDADPHVRWCGRGGAARLPPIPISRQPLPIRFDKTLPRRICRQQLRRIELLDMRLVH